MNTTFKMVLILLFGAMINACGSSGGGGSDDPDDATIEAANAKSLGITAMEGARQAVDNENNSSAIPLPRAALRMALIPVDIPNFCTSGSVTADATQTSSTINFNMCAYGGAFGIVADGTVVTQTSTSGNITTITTDYQDFTVTSNGTTQTVDFSSVCTVNTSTSDVSCTFSSDALGLDGSTTYGVSNASVSGDDTSGWDVSVSVDGPSGTITLETTQPILFDCAGGYPSSGVIVFTDADGVEVTVTFIDCNSFSVSYSGTSEVYTYN
ncbi:MAG: hypothetical protein GY806_08225 [Gammaproteobacteria bacterium]|nr:hypothetical protein [Gammaproteobacteria bacterium]